MQLSTSSSFNLKDVQNILKTENKFITDLLNILPLPNTISQSDEEEEEDFILENDGNDNNDTKQKYPSRQKKARAKSVVELQSRLQQMSSKKHLSYKERLLKKTIKSKIKKKGRFGQKHLQLKQEHIKTETKEDNVNNSNVDGPVGASSAKTDIGNGTMVFSKFDFSGIGKQKPKKTKKDPQKLLENLKKTKQEIKSLQESGEIGKAVQINEKVSWKNAFAKAEGIKVKDDEYLLAKSIKRHEQKKKQSKKKWEAREANVKKMKEERQSKRQENLDKKKKDKKSKKIKKDVKRGKIIPGF